MKFNKTQWILFVWIIFAFASFDSSAQKQNKDPYAAEIITTDLDNFWNAFDQAKPEFNPEIFQRVYLSPGSKGIKGFMKGRIRSAEDLSGTIKQYIKYYSSIKPSTDSIAGMKEEIRKNFARLKELYPEAVFPPVYFVIGRLNSGGTHSKNGLIIGAEMFGLTPETPLSGLQEWHKTVLKPVNRVPHIVAHEAIHFQQSYVGITLLGRSISEGSADFFAELTSGRHSNKHIHAFADPKEKELWLEFREKMNGTNFDGWLYSPSKGRPNDLGYWMGYKITKAYYDQAPDKKKAIHEILNIKNFNRFLEQSGYAQKFETRNP